MYLSDEKLVVSATDLVGFLGCGHLTALDRSAARGSVLEPEMEIDEDLEILAKRGHEHELAYADTFRSRGIEVTEIPEGSLREQVVATSHFLREGVEVVHQAAMLSDGEISWRGHADFLIRTERPSHLGQFSYEPEEAKLARRVTPGALIQLCQYAEQLERLQGVPPEMVHAVLGGGRGRYSFRLADYSAYYRYAKERFELVLRTPQESSPVPVEHCKVCRWQKDCTQRLLEEDDLSLVAGLRRDQARRLAAAGLNTVSGLAGLESNIPGMAERTLVKLRDQARLQIKARTIAGPPPWELLACEPGIGLGALPAPDPGDLFFDIEGDPHVGTDGLEYLFGLWWVESDGTGKYKAFWGHDSAGEKSAFESLVDFIMQRWAEHPHMHVYHYAPYEPAALGRLMGRYGTREAEVDQMLRADLLVDLYQVVRQGLRVGVPSYSIKKLEALYMPQRTQAVTDAGSSIVKYERWIDEGGEEILADLAEYNKVDCESTQLLRDWLEARRKDYETSFGLSPPRPKDPDVTGDLVKNEESESDRAALELRETLLEMAQAACDSESSSALSLLAELLEWHRRETRPEWWKWFYRVSRCGEDDLWTDSESIAGLNYLGVVGTVARSEIHRYSFDPAQEYKINVGDKPSDPEVEKSKLLGFSEGSLPGTVFALHRPGEIDLNDGPFDPDRAHIDLKRAKNSKAPYPRCLIPARPIATTLQREAIADVARWVIENGIDAPGEHRAARDLLLRRSPRLECASLQRTGSEPGLTVAAGMSSTERAISTALALDGGFLAVQGPPGAGKTYTAARAIVEMVKRGMRVGITANSHSVISHLLSAVVCAGRESGLRIRALQKAEESQAAGEPEVEVTSDNAKVVSALEADEVDVVAGTAWLFSRSDMAGKIDTLVVDEAAQLSLANVVAISISSRNMMLVGDPCQLAQPSKGSHPLGAEASALGHLLGEHATLPDDKGVFLPQTRRLHPQVCRFVSEIAYEGRLHAHPGCEVQQIHGDGPLSGSGLRWLPVTHRSNRTSSQEEVEVIAGALEHLLDQDWTDMNGTVKPLELDDVLVVAPYNAQVALLASSLPGGARIGTVDRFQGQEAAVVIVSMAASSASDVPRGIDFLFSRNRLNVAVSRAKALAVMVASPELLAVQCTNVEQMRLANGLCRYRELATPLST